MKKTEMNINDKMVSGILYTAKEYYKLFPEKEDKRYKWNEDSRVFIPDE